ncbi:FAD-binding and (Fe-S)-binding domain-containing protein [Bacteroidota bacterium]
MQDSELSNKLIDLSKMLDGELYTDNIQKIIYSTDASVYKEKPIAIARPENENDILKLIHFARNNNTSLIPRTAGTSLAGQVVGKGIVVDISKYFTKILKINKEEAWVRVQPGVVLDELNQTLKKYDLFFGPETSTANRCMIGGMVGNNACGIHSLIYGSTRDHLLSVKGFLSDGSMVEFNELTSQEFNKKCRSDSFEGSLYKNLFSKLKQKDVQEEILKEFPDPAIPRRNNGYAIDVLINTDPFSNNGQKINLSKLIAGSEGTLMFITEIKLNLVVLPPKEKVLLCAHFKTIDEALRANLIALKYKPGAIELMDDVILECTRLNLDQQKNRFFLKGDPAAILMIEFSGTTKKEIDVFTTALIKEMRETGFGYHFPIVEKEDISKVWELRKAGLGVLANIPGDKKSVAIIEDTAIKVNLLPDYINDIRKIFKKYGSKGVYYAHVGAGEIHLRPILDLKKEDDVRKFREIAIETARLVKSYKGSMSGEHGDGRLRANLIPIIIGNKNYELIKEIKKFWDPLNIFNPGKIVNAPPVDSNLRYSKNQITREIPGYFDFSSTMGIMRAVEKCNGSGDCRKSELIGGTMCPSYMASRDENKSTRARANVLREILTHSKKKNPFNDKDLYEIMDLCLSCKACKSECPSSIDMAKLKAEFLQHYYNSRGIPIRTRLIAYISRIYALGAISPGITNYIIRNKRISGIFMSVFGFSTSRSLPLLSEKSLKNWAVKNLLRIRTKEKSIGKILFFNDEFTNYNDTELGIKALTLLSGLGYEIIIPKHINSGRTFISKGLIKKAKKIANRNIGLLREIVNSKTPLIGIEPSAILTFRDEYPELVDKLLVKDSMNIAKNTFLIDEFLMKEMEEGRIQKDSFSKESQKIKFHGHCQQKAIASTYPTKYILSFPENYIVEEIPSGCCGMAGAFGYEKEHYDFSMKVGELVLFPEIRKCADEIIISAAGTSCRHHIKDGTGRDAKHPVEILFDAYQG